MVRAAWAWTRVLGGVGILAFVLWRLGTSAFLDSLHLLTGWTLGGALGIGLMTTVFSAWRWCLVARGLGIELPLRTAIADYYRALFVNAALPSGILGDVHRAVRNGKDSGDVGRGVRAVVLERFAGQVVLITFGVTVLLSHPTLAGHVNLPRALVAIAGVALVVAGIVLWVRRRGGRSRIGRGLRTGMTDIRRGLLARNRWPLLVLSSAIVVAGHLAMFVVAARAAGSHAPFLRLLPLMMLALFAMTLPVNIGGWGPREGVTAWAFGAAGLGATQGLTIAVLYGLFAFIAALPGVVVIAGQWAARAAAKRAMRVAVAGAESALDEIASTEPAFIEPAFIEPAWTESASTERAPALLRTVVAPAVLAASSNALVPIASTPVASTVMFVELPLMLAADSASTSVTASSMASRSPEIVAPCRSASGRPTMALAATGRSVNDRAAIDRAAIDCSVMGPVMSEHDDVDLRVAEPALVV